MTILFTLSNIAVPFIILSYTSLLRIKNNNQLYPAKWFSLIVYTFLSNLLFYFFEDNGFFLIIDLALKLAIVFLPEIANQPLERIIFALHLQVGVHYLRTKALPSICHGYAQILSFLMDRMGVQQRQHFKRIVINSLEKREQKLPAFNSNLEKVKKYKNISVDCDILTMDMIKKEIKEKQLIKIQLKSAKNQLSQSRSSLNNVQKSARQSVEQPNQSSMKKKKGAFQIQKSSTDLGLHESDEEERQVKRKVKASENKRQQKKLIQKDEDQPSMILNKLDVSEYSDMFEDEMEVNENRTLLVKVQSIIEITGIGSPRLQMYNIQLYSNDQIRIVSLYGREFQKHKLLSMVPLKHGYYELRLEGGKVQSRKVKFRGPHEPFLKFLSAQN